MTIEELKHIKDIVNRNDSSVFDYTDELLNLLDAEIERQSITDQDVQQAIEWHKDGLIHWNIEKERELRRTNEPYAYDMSREKLNILFNEIARSLYENRNFVLTTNESRRALRAIEVYLQVIFKGLDKQEVTNDDD